MATAAVTIKITPSELELIQSALALFHLVMNNIDQRKPITSDLTADDLTPWATNPYQAASLAARISRDLK